MSKKIRIHQFLTRTGLFEFKRDVFNALEKGQVTINGKTITNKDYQFKVNSSTITYKGKEVHMKE